MVRIGSVLSLVSWLFFTPATGFASGAGTADCPAVHRLHSLLPPQVVAYYGVEEVAHLERVDDHLEKALIRLALYDETLFSWNRLDDFSDVVLECSLSWRHNQVRLFEYIHGRSRSILETVQRYRRRLPALSDGQVGDWIAAGFSATDADREIRLGRSPRAAAQARE